MPRDTNKVIGQQKALGGALAALKGRVFNLVICGATDPDDGWLFADFLGFCKTMEKQSHQNSFLSCFPLDKHWQTLEKFKINNIKFGVYGEQREHLFKYERTQFDQCQPFWTQIAPKRMLHEILFSIGKHRRHCRPGDILNIFIVCHGANGGWSLVFGHNHMPVADLTTLLGKFKTNVHVNVFSVACYSGRIAQQLENAAQNNRYVAAPCMDDLAFAMTRCVSGRTRTGRFANALVESLMKSISQGEFWSLSVKCLIPPQIPWTVSHSDDHIRHRLRNASDQNRVFTAQFLHAGFDPVTMSMKELTSGENSIEANSDEKDDEKLLDTAPEPTPDETPATHHSSSPVDWHSVTAIAHEALARSLAASGQEVTPSAQAVAAAEGRLCDINLGNPADLGVFNGLYVEEPPWRTIMNNLYWRSFRQAAIWNVFLCLLGEGLVSAEALQVPINLLGSTTSTLNASCLLGCFQLFLDRSRGGFFGKIPSQSAEWTTDIEWYVSVELSQTALARNTTNIPSFAGLQLSLFGAPKAGGSFLTKSSNVESSGS